MRRTLLALVLALVTVLGFATFAVGNAGAWKCDRHPEKAPHCTSTTTSQPPVSVSQPNPSTSLPTTTAPATTTTSTTVPPVVPPPVTPPLVSVDPPSVIRLAG
jgi:ABC-type transport system substrate-binding protein